MAWLSAEIVDHDVEQRDYVGRPLLVTENDYELGLYNGDTGVIVRLGGQMLAVDHQMDAAALHLVHEDKSVRKFVAPLL